jgi:hypothetical protein
MSIEKRETKGGNDGVVDVGGDPRQIASARRAGCRNSQHKTKKSLANNEADLSSIIRILVQNGCVREWQLRAIGQTCHSLRKISLDDDLLSYFVLPFVPLPSNDEEYPERRLVDWIKPR